MLITLTTDFGHRDWFVGTMHGVIASIAPASRVIDICHEIPPGDVQTGAFVLGVSYCFFPPGTIHLAVVDPGVGSERPAIAVETANYFFVAPDNGVLSFALSGERVNSIRVLKEMAFFRQELSRTFHGRDIFAPAAAHLSLGTRIERLGPRKQSFTRLDWPKAVKKGNWIEGEVVYIDKFGNGITNIENKLVSVGPEGLCEVGLGPSFPGVPIRSHYAAVAKGKPVAVPGSTGFLEVAVNGGPAQQALKLEIGTKVRARTRKAGKATL